MIPAIRRALTLLDRRDRWRWFALVPLGALMAGLEAAGAAAVFLLVRMLADPTTVALPRALRWLAGAIAGRSVVGFAAMVVAFYVVRNVALLVIEHAQAHVIQRTASRIAVRLLARYLHAPYPFHFRRSSSSVIHAVRDSVDVVVEMVLGAAVHVASELLVACALIGLLATAAPRETLAALAAVVLLIVLPLVLSRRAYARWGEAERRTGERMIEKLRQALDLVKPIVVAGHQDYFVRRYADERAALERAKLRRTFATASLRLGVETVFICAMLLAVAILTASGRSGAESVSILSLFAYTGFRIVPAANRIIQQVNALRYGRSFVDALVADWRGLPAGDAAAAAAPLTRAIDVDAVSYTYEGASTPALHAVSFHLPKGTSLGVVGPTGSGKSTLLDIVLGLLSPQSGRVTFDGVDCAAFPKGWRRQVGYVPQEVVLIDDTLQRNIALGVADSTVDRGRLARAVAHAQLETFVAGLPDGFDTVIGERGVRLSGGERQRIAIARALYHEPSILVFDEATSALDPLTARDVAAAIEQSRGQRTVIVVAHRLATVRACDRILVIERGRVVAQGSYAELMASSEVFRALANSS